MYGKGFCFGMAVAVLLNFYSARTRRPSLVELPLTPDLLSTLREHQLQQFRIRMVLATMRDWAASELDPSLGKDATLKEVLDSGALGKEGPDAPESLSAKRRKKKGE